MNNYIIRLDISRYVVTFWSICPIWTCEGKGTGGVGSCVMASPEMWRGRYGPGGGRGEGGGGGAVS